MNPLVHYLRHGRNEGRLPRENPALALDRDLWGGAKETALPALASLLQDESKSAQERSYAAWSLARWHACEGDWARAIDFMRIFRQFPSPLPGHHGPSLLEVEAFIQTAAYGEAEQRLQELLEANPGHPDFCLAYANLLAARSKPGNASQEQRLEWINRPYQAHTLATLCLQDAALPLTLDNIRANVSSAPPTAPPANDYPLVSVIVPAFNAGKTLRTALTGLARQSWQNIEVLIVDDCSTDETFAVAEGFAERDRRFKVLRHAENQGPYAARNSGLAAAGGEFITTHDSDDWSHPQKIELQVRPLQNAPDLAATTSHWVRATTALEFGHWRIEEGWIYRNVSSLLFRRRVFEQLGYWDRVKVNGDTEYFYRVMSAFGKASIAEVLPGVPLAFGRYLPGSLSQTAATHLRTQFSGVRKDYHEAALEWHARAKSPDDLYLPAHPGRRPFPAPADICLDRPAAGASSLPPAGRGLEPTQTARIVREPGTAKYRNSDLELIRASALFDAGWYLESYPDVAEAGADPALHFLLHGAAEGRDPGPGFSSSGYRQAYPDVAQLGLNPLVHYLKFGLRMGRSPLPFFQGTIPVKEHRKNILVCGHQAEAQLYGAELSLIDVLTGLGELGFNTYVSLPKALNSHYLEELRNLSTGVWVRPYHWWRADRPTCVKTQESFEQFLRQQRIDFLYANTLTILEPLLAARAADVKTVVHVRELPEHDPALCETLGADPARIREHVLGLADVLVANSGTVACYLDRPGTFIVPNTVDAEVFDLKNDVDRNGLKVGMISSNTPKKGIYDFVEMARILAADAPQVRCLLIGPDNRYIDELKAQQALGEIPGNLEFPGYAATPQDAMAQINILLNLSHFQESFGRTALEAMAARRPVVGYRWGALPELIVHGETGFLAPFGDIAAVAKHVKTLADDPESLRRMGEAGRLLAEERYGMTSFVQKLRAVFPASDS